MTAPTIDVTWDSNGTNTLGGGTTSGHRTDGYGVGEVPTSTELNTWMEGVGAWINYLRAPDAAWRWEPPRGDLDAHMSRSTTTGYYSNASNQEGKITGIPVVAPVGSVLTDIGINYSFGGSVSASDCTLKLYRDSADGSAAATLIATLTFASGSLSSGHIKSTTPITGGNTSSGAAETVADGSSYYFDLDLNTGSSVNSVGVGAVGFKSSRNE